MTLWMDALKEWNQGKSGWCVPRKGTTEYTQVMQIVDRLKPREMPKPRNLERRAIEVHTQSGPRPPD